MAEYNPIKWQPATEKKALPFTPSAEDDMSGFVEINNNTMAIPFLRILQSGSPQVKKNNEQRIDGADEGMFFNTVSKKVYGKKVKLIVLKFERVYIEWLPKREGFVAYHDPENADRIATDKTFGNWKHGENLLQENYVYLVLVEGEEADGPMVLSLASTMIKTAREWNRLLVTHVVENMRMLPYYLVWNVETEYIKKDEYDWYIPKIAFSNLINEKQYVTYIQKERKALPTRQIDYAALESKGETGQTPVITGKGNKEKIPY